MSTKFLCVFFIVVILVIFTCETKIYSVLFYSILVEEYFDIIPILNYNTFTSSIFTQHTVRMNKVLLLMDGGFYYE